MIDTVAISGGSDREQGFNGDQFFSHIIEDYSEPRSSGSSAILWFMLFLFAVLPLGYFGLKSFGGLDAVTKMLSPGSSNPLVGQPSPTPGNAAKPKIANRKPQPVANPTMNIELLPPGSVPIAGTGSIAGTVLPAKPIAIVPVVPVVPVVPTTSTKPMQLVQIERIQVNPQPDVGFGDISLPAGITKPIPGLLNVISPATRGELQGMMQHRFAYKQYAAMERLRRLRLAGSENLLRQGLSHRKFWTRMEALFGLAEIGAQLSPADLQAAIGSARPFLQKSYFKRFKKGWMNGGIFYRGPNLAEKYILSLCMYFVGEQAQGVISEAIRS
jgi:hypothetical protein